MIIIVTSTPTSRGPSCCSGMVAPTSGTRLKLVHNIPIILSSLNQIASKAYSRLSTQQLGWRICIRLRHLMSLCSGHDVQLLYEAEQAIKRARKHTELLGSLRATS
eukprot:358287-Amphidinium_carterae.1